MLRSRTAPIAAAALLLVMPVAADAQVRSPLFERAGPKAIAATQAPIPRSGRDSLVNGTMIGAAVGAALGIVFAHATRDSELEATQYAYGALVFGGIGGGIGLGLDALLDRGPQMVPRSPRKVALHTRVARKSAGVRLTMRW